MINVVSAPGGYQVRGLVPDAVTSVSIASDDKQPANATVVDNGFTVGVGSMPTRLIWTDAKGLDHYYGLRG